MKREVRPFVVEVKHKRGSQKRSGTIWGDVDLASIAAETAAMELTNSQLIHSSVAAVVSEHGRKPRAELDMPNPKETETVETMSEEPVVGQAPVVKKAPRSKSAKSSGKRAIQGESNSDAPTKVQPSNGRAGRKVHSEKERALKLEQIEKSIGGGASVKNATAQAGISEQTYYQWKKVVTPASASGDLKDLLALEEENKRLKNLLAERLRKENAELRKKLGLR